MFVNRDLGMKIYINAIKLTALVVLVVVVSFLIKEIKYSSIGRIERLMDIELPEVEARVLTKEENSYDATEWVNHIYLEEPLSQSTKATIESRCSDPQNEDWEHSKDTSYCDYRFRDSDARLVCRIAEKDIYATYTVGDNDGTYLLLFVGLLWAVVLLVWALVLLIMRAKSRDKRSR